MNRPLTAIVPALMAVVATTTPAVADTWHVPDDFATIQAAIDAAANGDVIVVADGTYTGPGNHDMDFGGRAITVRSENGAAACIIDLQDEEDVPHRAFHFDSGETAASVVDGLTIENGVASRGAAVLCEAGSSPLFQACIFLLNTVIQDVAEDGGGAVYTLDSSPTFIDCVFMRNQVETNVAFAGGGAVQIQSGGDPTFTGCLFLLNSATGINSDGGAVLLGEGCHPEFSSCTFTGNEADWDAAIVVYGNVTMHDCRFEGNNTTSNAGGAYGQYGAPFGGGSATLVNCSFIGNTAVNSGGGAVVVQFTDATAMFTNCLFADNTAGGGVGYGGGLWAGNGAEVVVTNCTFTGNSATQGGGALRVRDGAIVSVINGVLWENAPGEIAVFGADPTITYSDIEGGWAGTGNIDADPLFVDPDNGDFGLSAASPAIDAADNTALAKGIETDLGDDPRFAHDPCTADTGTPDGTNPPVDMGAHEFQPPCPTDFDCSGDVGVGDLLSMLAAWGLCAGCPEDIDNSGDVGIVDLLALLGGWGPCS